MSSSTATARATRFAAVLVAIGLPLACASAEATRSAGPGTNDVATAPLAGDAGSDATLEVLPAPACVPTPQRDACSLGEVVTREGCPFPACSCPSGCYAVEAMIHDGAACYREGVLGCVRTYGVIGMTTDGMCIQRTSDGLQATVSSMIQLHPDAGATLLVDLLPGWSLCPPAKYWCDAGTGSNPQCL